MQNREVEILAKGREADFGMNEFPSGGSKLSYRGIRHPASFHWPLNSRNTVGEEMQGVSFVHTHTRLLTKYFTACSTCELRSEAATVHSSYQP